MLRQPVDRGEEEKNIFVIWHHATQWSHGSADGKGREKL
jgi:hypothetical protein